MIVFRNIQSADLENYINSLDTKISYIKHHFGFELKSYGPIIRVAMNAIQREVISNLIERASVNRELEKELENAGGYTLDFLGDNNPKNDLMAILNYLNENLPKRDSLIKYLMQTSKKTIVISDSQDVHFLKRNIKNRKVEIINYAEFRKINIKNQAILFYSFNGEKDFNSIYNIKAEMVLLLYKQEKNLYYKYLNQRKNLIENEIQSKDRISICGIQYTETRTNVANISTTINEIVSRLDEMNDRIYAEYKNECDLLLSELEDKLIYKITSDQTTLLLESTDIVFDEKGNSKRLYQVKVGDKIRFYPKIQLAENLYQVAVENEPDIFGLVEHHATYWKQLIAELRKEYNDDLLYTKLKERGLRILPSTLATYGKGYRKFPMFNKDLRAIFRLYFHWNTEDEIDEIVKPFLKSKATYISTMIVLGRGIKHEFEIFIKENRIGEILKKKNFNNNTLQKFIREYMPLHTILSKEVLSEKIEISEEELQQIEI